MHQRKARERSPTQWGRSNLLELGVHKGALKRGPTVHHEKQEESVFPGSKVEVPFEKPAHRSAKVPHLVFVAEIHLGDE